MQQRSSSLVLAGLLAASAVVIALLSACGQKGPLTPLPAPRASTPATPASAALPSSSSASSAR